MTTAGSVFEQVLLTHDNDKVAASVEVAHALMEGDEATFKAGYTQANAVLAVKDLYSLTADQVRLVNAALAGDDDG